MKEKIKSQKSIRKQKKKFDSSIEQKQKHTFKVLEEKGEKSNIRKYCENNKLNYHRVEDVLVSFQIFAKEVEDAPTLLLEFIKESGITSDYKVNKVIEKIRKSNKDKEDIENYITTYYNKSSVSIKLNYEFADEKVMLRHSRVNASINKRFYNYLVKENYLVDYRKPENWDKEKQEKHLKKLNAPKRGANE